jgi:hypothetical protein
MTFFGEEYDRITLRSSAQTKKRTRKLSDEKSGKVYQVGRFCWSRSALFHSLHHYRYNTLKQIEMHISSLSKLSIARGNDSEVLMKFLGDEIYCQKVFDEFLDLHKRLERFEGD